MRLLYAYLKIQAQSVILPSWLISSRAPKYERHLQSGDGPVIFHGEVANLGKSTKRRGGLRGTVGGHMPRSVSR
jgi:hypothetical protein